MTLFFKKHSINTSTVGLFVFAFVNIILGMVMYTSGKTELINTLNNWLAPVVLIYSILLLQKQRFAELWLCLAIPWVASIVYNMYGLFIPANQWAYYQTSLYFKTYYLMDSVLAWVFSFCAVAWAGIKYYEAIQNSTYPSSTHLLGFGILNVLWLVAKILVQFELQVSGILLGLNLVLPWATLSILAWSFSKSMYLINYNQPTSNISRQAIIFQEIENLLKNQQLYTNTDLTLQYLAQVLNVSSKELSEAIRNETGLGYYDYIGQVRVSMLKQKLISDGSQKQTIEEMTQQCGFKSKSTLYLHFKKIEGCTPREYERKMSA